MPSPPSPYDLPPDSVLSTLNKDNNGNGFVWHTTGSGKTLTSFKTTSFIRGRTTQVAIK